METMGNLLATRRSLDSKPKSATIFKPYSSRFRQPFAKSALKTLVFHVKHNDFTPAKQPAYSLIRKTLVLTTRVIKKPAAKALEHRNARGLQPTAPPVYLGRRAKLAFPSAS